MYSPSALPAPATRRAVPPPCLPSWRQRPLFRWHRLGLGLAVVLAAASPALAVTYSVTSTGDTGAGSGTSGDLRYCITQANANPGSTINLVVPSNPTITLTAPLPVITASMTIQPGVFATPIIDGAGLYRGFFIDAPGGTVTISGTSPQGYTSFVIRNCRAKGGDGGLGGGGGGAGMGAAVFVNAGSVTLDGVVFSNVAATGGKGGDGYIAADSVPGGGGGLGGNGGTAYGGGGGFRGNGATGNGGETGSGIRYAGSGGGGLIGSGGSGGTGIGGGGGGTTSASFNTPGGGGGAGGQQVSGSYGGGNGSLYGGGGGAAFSLSPGPDGGRGGRYGGGGGGNNTASAGGAGGDFGGGGAGSNFTTDQQGAVHGGGGNGGFGGGGGARHVPSPSDRGNGGSGGFGGGNAAADYSGGDGGSAFGGAVFVRASTGGSLTLRNSPVVAGTLTAGAGGAAGMANTISGRVGVAGTTGGSGIFAHGATAIQMVVDSDQTCSGGFANDAGGSLQIVKSGDAALTLAGASTFTGAFFSQAGTVRLGSATGFGASTNSLQLNNSVLDLNGFSLTIGDLSGNGVGYVTNGDPNPAVLTVAGAPGGTTADFDIRDDVGSIALVKTGPGAQTLHGLSSFSGGTTVNGGTLFLTGADNNGYGTIIGAITVAPGAYLRPLVQNAFGYANGRKVNSVVVNGATLSHDGAGDQGWGVAYTLSNGSNMVSNGGVNDPAGNGRWSFGGPGAGATPNANSSVLVTGTGTSQIFGRIDLRADNGNSSSTFTVNAGAALSVPAYITDSAGPATLVKAGPGTMTLLAGNPYTGGTVVNGGTLVLGANGNGLGTIRGGLTINPGATVSGTVIDAMGYNPGQKLNSVVLNGTAVLRNDAQGSLGWGVTYTLNGGTLLSNNGASSTTAASNLSFGGPAGQPTAVNVVAGTTPQIQGRVELRTDNNNQTSTFNVDTNGVLSVPAGVSGAGGIIKSGPGTMVLSGTNTYSGGANLAGGTLAITNASALGASGGITFSGGTLRYDFAPAAGSDFSPRFVAPASGQAVRLDTNGQSVTLATTPITGAGGLVKAGSGVLTLNGAQSYAGGTTILGGTLRLGDGTTAGSLAGNVANSGTLEFAPPGAQSYAGIVSGTGGLTKSGAGTLTLSAAQAFTGATTVSAGTLALGSAAALSTGGVSIGTSGTLATGGSAINGLVSVTGVITGTGGTLGAGLTVNNGGRVFLASGSLTLGGAVVNNGTIRLTSGATLLAGSASSFVNNGVLDLITAGSGTALPAGFTNGPTGIVLTGDLVRVKDVARGATDVTIRIDGYTGHAYRLQRSSSLTNAFQDVTGVPPQTGTTGAALTFVDPSPTPGEAFYRIAVD